MHGDNHSACGQVRTDEATVHGGALPHDVNKSKGIPLHRDGGHHFAEDIILLLLITVYSRKTHINDFLCFVGTDIFQSSLTITQIYDFCKVLTRNLSKIFSTFLLKIRMV